MKFYLAGRYEDLPLLRDVAFLLIQSGHIVTSRWLRGETPKPETAEELRIVAEQDLSDIRDADCFVLYSHTTPPWPTRQGHSVELGYAMGYDISMPIIIVGERTLNVFHYCKRVVHLSTWQEFFEKYGIIGQLLNGGQHAARSADRECDPAV